MVVCRNITGNAHVSTKRILAKGFFLFYNKFVDLWARDVMVTYHRRHMSYTGSIPVGSTLEKSYLVKIGFFYLSFLNKTVKLL